MRHFSERVPGKNYRNFANEPLYRRILSTLLACPEINTVMIDTDSDVIMEDASKHFPSVLLYRRPPHLRDEFISMNDVLLNSVSQIEADLYLQTHSTNPLLRPETISGAIHAFSDRITEFDSLFTVTRLQTRLWTQSGKPVNHDPEELRRTQDLEPVYEENSCMYLFDKSTLAECGSRIGKRPMLYEIPKLEAHDIDDEQDFQIAEALFNRVNSNGFAQ